MRHPLPYAFARSSQLLIEDDGQETVLWHSPQPDWSAVSEVQRKHASEGGVRLLYAMPLRGCHACADDGTLTLGYDFDAGRRYIGRQVVEVR